MLQSLHVHNFALLEEAEVEFTEGFNVFTGETGAGKSILIDAFSMVLGGRGSADYVRTGTDSLWVQAVFDVSEQNDVKKLLQEHGLEPEDGILFLRRQITAAGKSKALINGTQVPLSFLRNLGSLLVDIHGQHENQVLLEPDTPRLITDTYGGTKVAEKRLNYVTLYENYLNAQHKLLKLEKDNNSHDLLVDRYEWEIKEIKNAALKVGEEQALEEEAKLLAHSEKILSSTNKAYDILDGDEGVLSILAEAKEALQHAARYDERLKSICENADSAWITLEDCRTEISSYLASSDFNKERAFDVQDRLDTIYKLHKKYGGSTEAVLQHLQDTEAAYAALKNIEEAIVQARLVLKKATEALTAAGQELTLERKISAKLLSNMITRHIKDLAMPDGQFEIKVRHLETFAPHGCDDIVFMFSANLGEPLAELEKVASGGELSRIALALKTVMMDTVGVSTMVFDEIDTGVGGLTALKMAEKMARIATIGQVLCITHLPQIAAFADNHINIKKQTVSGRTVTSLTALNEEGRVTELVRMLAGSSESTGALNNAKELLENATEFKISLMRSRM